MAKVFFDSGKTEYTQKLAEYAANLSFDQLPANVIEKAKLMTMHTIGASIAARPDELTAASIRVAKRINGEGGGAASVWSSGDKLSMANAAFANGTISDILDWEDCAYTGHPSAGVIPVAMAIAEADKLDGKDYLTGVVAGFEVYSRVAMAVQPPAGFEHSKGWGLTSWQIYAAAAAAAKLFHLDAKKTNQTYGMAALFSTIASNLQQATMSNAYHYEHGISAQDGLIAAMCAQEGFDNLENAFDIPYAYSEHLTSEVDYSWFNKELGTQWYILDVLIKHWPANMWVQTPLEAIMDMVKEHNITADNIEEIIIDPPTQYRMNNGKDGFTSLMEAQFSTPYLIAVALLDPEPGHQWFARDKFTDPQVLDLAHRVKPGLSKEDTLGGNFTKFQNGDYPEKHFTIRTKDGRIFERKQKLHKGHPDDMFSWPEISELFLHQVTPVLGAEKAELLLGFFTNLENESDLSKLGTLL